MDGFVIFNALHHLLIILIISFFVLFAASRADGIIRLFGYILGGILFVLAILSVVFAVMHPADHGNRDAMWFGRMHHGWMPWPHGPQATPSTQPATPATPAPANPTPANPAPSTPK